MATERQRAAADRAKTPAPAAEPDNVFAVRLHSLRARLAEMDADDSDAMVWTALMGGRLGTDDVKLDAILTDHRRCPRGYCEHRQAVDRHAEAIGWDD